MADIQEMHMDGETEQGMRSTLQTLFSILMMIVIVGAVVTSAIHWKASSYISGVWVGVIVIVLFVVAIASSCREPNHHARHHPQPEFRQSAVSIRVDHRTNIDEEEEISRRLQALPEVAFAHACSRARYVGVGTECGISLEEFDLNDKVHVLTPCDHAFHVHCIRRWIALTMCCLLCRGRVLIQRTDINPLTQSSEAAPFQQTSSC
ncbi:hypothetical protein KP509_10G089900 [Ceratopteris richardii]|uniref:RING-type domain-containing protein n=1 Tax=Ceratopteris richardii TaxID=49495 RepID=A0A8T2TXA6_CERRI|nr:hypothetical protein KP509_10G089900 [Ceratopteris richardii]